MRKIKNLVFITVLALFISITTVNAEVLTVDEVGDRMSAYSDGATYGYIVGDYIFTAEYFMAPRDMMLAARSIRVTDTLGKLNTDPIFGEMQIYFIQDVGTGWVVEEYIGPKTEALPTTFNIEYIDYNGVANFEKFEVKFVIEGGTDIVGTFKVGTLITAPAEDPEKAGYVFIGWEDADGVLLNEGTDSVTKDVVYTARFAEDVDVDTLVSDAVGIVEPTSAITVSYANGIITFNVLDNDQDFATATGHKLLGAFKNLLANPEIKSLTFTVGGTDVEIVESDLTLSPSPKLLALIGTIAGESALTATYNDIIGVDFDLVVNLEDGYVISSKGNATTATYSVEIDGTADTKVDVDALVETAVNVVVDTPAFEINYAGGTITFDIINNSQPFATATGHDLLKAFRNILSNPAVKALTFTVDGTDIEITEADLNANPALKLVDLIEEISGESYATAIYNDIVGKTFTFVVELNDGYVALDKTTSVEYDVEIDGTVVAYVSTEAELKAALADSNIELISIIANFSVTESMIVNNDVTINGNTNTITMTGNTTWVTAGSNYIFKVNGTSNVTFKDINLTGSNAAIIVLAGAEATVDGVNVSGNRFGGIEVVGTLTVDSIINLTEDTYEPTIWVDAVDYTRVTLNITHSSSDDGTQTFYYIND